MNIYSIQNWLEHITIINPAKSKYHKIFYFIFCFLILPIKITFEFIVYWNIWRKIILPEFIQHDEIINFLDKNNFGLQYGRLIKYDVIDEDNTYYAEIKDLDLLKVTIKKEFATEIIRLIEKHSNFDINNYITVLATTKILPLQFNGTTVFKRIYSISIQYWRYYFLIKDLKYLIVWILLGMLIFFGINSEFFSSLF